MKYYHALKNSAYNFRIDLGKLGFIFSLVAIGYVSSISNTPCLEAQSTCAVGSNPVFSENINIKGGTAFTTTIDGSSITGNRTLTLADTDMDLSNALVATGALTNNTPLKIDSGGNVVSQDLVPETDLTTGSGTAGQMLAVNSGATALEFVNSYSPPVLTASKVMATDGTGAFSTTDVYPLSLTALKVLATDASGALTVTDVYPLSFSANKPIVSDVSGNLTDITLTGDTPMKTDANGNLTATDLVPETDLTTGSGTAGQMLVVNSGATALEFVDAGGLAGGFSAIANQNLVPGSVGLESNGEVRNVVVEQNSSNELNMGTKQFIEGDSNYHNGYNVYIYHDSNSYGTCDSGLHVTGAKFTNSTTAVQFTDTCIDNSWTTACNSSGANCQTTGTSPSSEGNVQLINIDSSSGKSDKYVLLYTGTNQNTSCCMWGRVIDVNSTIGTFTIGSREMIHDENTCNNNSACNYYSTSYNIYPTTATGIWDAGASKLRVGYSRVHNNSIGTYPKFTTVSLSGTTLTRDSDYANELTGNFWGAFSAIYGFSMFYDHSTALTGWCYRTSNYSDSSLWALDWTGTQGGNAGYGAYAWAYQAFWGQSYSIPASMTTENVQLNSWYDGLPGCGDNSSIHYDYDAERYIKTMQGYPGWGQSWDYNNVLVSFNINNDTSSWKAADCDFSTDNKCYDAYYTNINNVNNQNVSCQNQSGKGCYGQLYGNNMTYDDTNNKWYWIDFAQGTSASVPAQNCGVNGGVVSCPIAIQFSIDANDKPVWERTFKYTFPDVGNTETYYVSWRFGYIPLYDDTNSVLGTTQVINDQVGAFYNNFGAVVIPDNISSYIGYVGQSANQGDAVTVISVGGIIEGLTGLTIGEEYYVKSDGSYGTTGEYLVGRAIATDKIYVSNTR